MVAVVILALGLLGLAGMQAKSLSNDLSAYNRSQATQLAYDIADRMRSNVTVLANYITPSPSTCPNNTNPCTACTTAVLTCTPAQLAQKDLFEWNRNITATLGNGATGTISNPGGAFFTVTVSWDDDKDPVTGDLNFAMSFGP
ncbi:MAG: type IV pilus modification protein PilV [Methylococcaceae bacterium]|nr:type IV pilus modification protein PilV [Methylococcaceae bacterium]